MIKEADIRKYLLTRVKALGGITRKVKWENHVGAPDVLVMLPEIDSKGPAGLIPSERFLVELKAPGAKPRASQTIEHMTLRRFGWRVEVVDSFERVDEVLR